MKAIEGYCLIPLMGDQQLGVGLLPPSRWIYSDGPRRIRMRGAPCRRRVGG